MDWPRAKAILILAFSLLNIFLGVLTFSSRSSYRDRWPVPTQADIRRLEDRLKAAGMTLPASWPLRTAPLPFLLVKARPVDGEDLAKRVFGINTPGVSNRPGEKTFSDGRQTLLVTDSGVIRYYREGPAGGKAQKVPDKSEAKGQAEAFLNRRGLPDGARLDLVQQDMARGRTVVCFTQVYEGLEIYGSEIWLEYSSRGLEEYREKWLIPVGFTGEKRMLVSPLEALSRVAERAEAFPAGERAIESISPGYYTEMYDARQWEVPPVWRVRFRDGTSLYLNAYTGEPEKKGETGK